MKRAIVVFLENKYNLQIQFFCLYNSFKFIKTKDTDLVVFCTKDIIDKIPNDCIKIEIKAASEDLVWKNYHYINSIAFMNSYKSSFLNDYDLILRTDLDTFLTPAFNNYYPSLYTVGKGGYVNDEYTKEKLVSISNKLGLKHKGWFNIGSTHYGNATLVKEVCKLATDITKYILQNEFKENEGKWPGWYKGVSSLYASEIALNHLIEKIIIDKDKLDFQSTSEESIYNHPHIHCWHTNDRFSKFMFECGKYNNLDINKLNIDKIRDYCTYIALTSK